MSDREQLENTIREFYRARDKGDIDAMMALFDPACRFRIAGSDKLGSITQQVDGQAALREAVTTLVDTWDLSNVRITSLHVDGDTVFVHRTGEIRFIPSGEVTPTELLDKLTFRNGLVVDYLEFVDTLLVADTIGLFDT
ncbi:MULTISPECIES: nuclear transport factor 2 family protein [unclassified Sinorhizobium]|uniref:nuclear transport factor 2 family protein n=1 Tax=unclassified Sinorhizobium TaxID=2613772 RepID=UPI003524859E